MTEPGLDEQRALYDGITLRDLFRDKDGKVYEVVAIATEPIVTVRQVGAPDGETQHHVIRSPLFRERFEHLTLVYETRPIL